MRELILVHGRWNYRRISKMVLHMLYKNFVFVLPIFYLGCMAMFSGQRVFTEVFSQMYNVALTQLPVMAFGIWDQDVNRTLSLKFPQMYKVGIRNAHFGRRAFLSWAFFALWHSLVVYWIPVLGLSGYRVTADKFVSCCSSNYDF